MRKDKMTYRWLWSCLIAGGLLLLMGCSGSSEEVPQPLPEPQPQPQPEEGSPLELRAVTRTDGATSFTGNQNIRIFLTTPTEYESGQFDYSATGWVSGVSVKEERQYYLYGYMPSSISTVGSQPSDGSYADGIDLALSNPPVVTLDDVCVVVGVQRVTQATIPPETPDVRVGSYSYRSGIKGQNYVNLLMAHLYSKLSLSFKIDEKYAELRSIHLKKVELSSKYSSGTVTVNLRKGQGIGSPTYPAMSEASETQKVTLFNSETAPEKVLDHTLATSEHPEVALDIPGYCMPITAAAGTLYNLTLTTTYDVYDRAYDSEKGKIVDKNNLGTRTAVNKIRLDAASFRPGEENSLVLTVKPTYLYILSDEDLDSPVITIN